MLPRFHARWPTHAEAVDDFSAAIELEPRFHDFHKRRGQALMGALLLGLLELALMRGLPELALMLGWRRCEAGLSVHATTEQPALSLRGCADPGEACIAAAALGRMVLLTACMPTFKPSPPSPPPSFQPLTPSTPHHLPPLALFNPSSSLPLDLQP